MVPVDTFLVVDLLVVIRFLVSGWHVVLTKNETFWFERVFKQVAVESTCRTHGAGLLQGMGEAREPRERVEDARSKCKHCWREEPRMREEKEDPRGRLDHRNKVQHQMRRPMETTKVFDGRKDSLARLTSARQGKQRRPWTRWKFFRNDSSRAMATSPTQT